MEVTRFDALLKAWGSLPRRLLLGGLATGTLGTLLGVAARDAAATSCHKSHDCSGKKICKNHVCIAKCGDPGVCGTFSSCGSGDCFCTTTHEGRGLCVQNDLVCTDVQECTSHSNCPEGLVCGTGCCTGGPEFTCLPPCGG